MIFHELAHQVLYVKDDTLFNESFATAVERLGGERWLQLHGSPTAKNEYAALDGRRRQLRALALATRLRLAQIYKQTEVQNSDKASLRKLKNQTLQDFRDDYARLKKSWGGYAAYDPWVAGVNNAALGAQAAYDELVPAFEAVFERADRDWPRFYADVKRLAQLPRVARTQALQQMVVPHATR